MDIRDIARIGLLFLSGDDVQRAMTMPDWRDSDYIDFDHQRFNSVKQVLLRIERIDPGQRLFCAVWTRRPDDANACEVIALGSKRAWGPRPLVWPPSPEPFWEIMPMFDALSEALEGAASRAAYPGAESWFFPIRDSETEIAGALELRKHAQTAPLRSSSFPMIG